MSKTPELPTITIPATIEEMIATLTDHQSVITAKEWSKAATLATWVYLPGSGGDHKSSDQTVKVPFDRMNPEEFARLGLTGLRSPKTVRRYVRRWISTTRPIPKPGEQVDLNGLPDWESVEPEQSVPKASHASKIDAGDVVREQGGEAIVSALTPHQQQEVRRALNKRDQEELATMRLESDKFAKHVRRDDIDAMMPRINPHHPDADVLDMSKPGAVGHVIDRAGTLLHTAGLHWSDVDIEERDHVRERIRMVRVEMGVLEMYAFDTIPGMDEES